MKSISARLGDVKCDGINITIEGHNRRGDPATNVLLEERM